MGRKMHLLRLALALLPQAVPGVVAQSERVWFRWRTEPEIKPQVFDVTQITSDRQLLAPGYLFITPKQWQLGWGPKIYDTQGLLIWDGNYTSGMIPNQFDVCDYGEDKGKHLCWHEASLLGIYKQKQLWPDTLADQNRIFDNTYKQVNKNLSNTGALESGPDSHEFRVIGNTFLQNVYPRKLMDLSQWTGPEDGTIQDSCFQEISLVTGDVLFSWCYLDNLPLETEIWVKSDAQTNFSSLLGGYGITISPWDFYHLNSVDKNFEGDYLVSGRHADQVMKIAGPSSPNGAPGTVLWRLGGPSNQFEMEGGFTFTRQHHASFVYTESNETMITLFDNAWEGESESPSAQYSSGKLIRLNNETMKATLVQEYPQPNGYLSRSGGSIQMLPNNNMLVSWGFIREVTEFHYNGSILYHAELKNIDADPSYDYRNFKHEWVAYPAHPPKLLTYSRDCNISNNAPLIAYVSWNGATEVASWRFLTSEFAEGPWIEGVTIVKNDFETQAQIADYYSAYVAVQALDRDGNVLSTASTMTFVPRDDILESCDDNGCFVKEHFALDEKFSRAEACIWKDHALLRRGEKFLGFAFVALLCGLSLTWLIRLLPIQLRSFSTGSFRYSRVSGG